MQEPTFSFGVSVLVFWAIDRCGSRNGLGEVFLVDIHAAWLEHGRLGHRPIEGLFLLAMLKIARLHRVEVGRPDELDRPCSHDAWRRLEEQPGAKSVENVGAFPREGEKRQRSDY